MIDNIKRERNWLTIHTPSILEANRGHNFFRIKLVFVFIELNNYCKIKCFELKTEKLIVVSMNGFNFINLLLFSHKKKHSLKYERYFKRRKKPFERGYFIPFQNNFEINHSIDKLSSLCRHTLDWHGLWLNSDILSNTRFTMLRRSTRHARNARL